MRFLFITLKKYKSITDSLENCIITNCIVFSIILNYLMFIIKLSMGENIIKPIKFVPNKHPVVQGFILTVCKNHEN